MTIAQPVEVLRFGGHRMIKGQTRADVAVKLRELITTGANVVLRPRLVNGTWVAICDQDTQFYKWN